MDEKIEKKIDEMMAILTLLVSQRQVQEWYDTTSAAEELNRHPYTVREWRREGRCNAKKRDGGRGKALEWIISREEIIRLKSEGLLPRKLPR